MSLLRTLGTLVVPLALAGSVLAAPPPEARRSRPQRTRKVEPVTPSQLQGTWQRGAAPRPVGNRSYDNPVELVPIRRVPAAPQALASPKSRQIRVGGAMAVLEAEPAVTSMAPRGLRAVLAIDDDSAEIQQRLSVTQGNKPLAVLAESPARVATPDRRRTHDRRQAPESNPVDTQQGVIP